MKTGLYSILVIGLLFVACQKEQADVEQEEQVIAGRVYEEYTQVVENTCDLSINVSGEVIHFNKSEAIYSSHRPTSNQNVFMIYLSDTTSNKKISLEIYTPFIKPEQFFSKSIYQTDSLGISWSGVSEDFYNANAVFKWDTASFNTIRFSGNASLEIREKMFGTINPQSYYPPQQLEFEFK